MGQFSDPVSFGTDTSFIKKTPVDKIKAKNTEKKRLTKEQQKENIRYLKKRLHFYWQKLVVSPFFLFSTVLLFLFIPEDLIKERLASGIKKVLNENFKRLLDIMLSTIGICIFLPFFILIPIIIRLDSKGPVLYKQLRVGKNRRRGDDWNSRLLYQATLHSFDRRKTNLHGQPFFLYKFRSMYQDAEFRTGPVWASRNDPRITRIGRILRATHLDELPQFFNVLKGEMSLVGPRPERPCFVVEFAEVVQNYTDRFQIKPGITGSAQIYNGYDSCLSDVKNKLNYELDYIKHGSIFSDIKLIFVTVISMIKGEGGK
jgi:lipopolysaccharide/colanic/teichoic acid biosynthesis glycosyltransferase